MKKSKRDGPWSEMPEAVIKEAHRPLCTICGRAYGKLSVGVAGAFLKVEEAIHHIFARRWLEKRDLYPHDPENLISVCKSDHGKLLQSEECLWSGDTVGFVQGMNRAGLPLELITKAARHYELSELRKFFTDDSSCEIFRPWEGDLGCPEKPKNSLPWEGVNITPKPVDNKENLKSSHGINGLQNKLSTGSVDNARISLDTRMGGDAFPRNRVFRMPIHKLLEQVAQVTGQSVDSLRSPSHNTELVSARRQFARLARLQGLSYPAIGRYLNRHHTTIMNLVRKNPWAKNSA